jgi:hypothetical protein
MSTLALSAVCRSVWLERVQVMSHHSAPVAVEAIVISIQSLVGEPVRDTQLPVLKFRTEALPAFFTPSIRYSCPLDP